MINVISTTEVTGEARATEFQMLLSDGTELFYRAWFPREPTRKALVVFHRGHEHSGRLEDVVRDLRLRDVAVFAWDARGHGRSGGPRGYAPSFGCLARDTDEFIRHIAQTHGLSIENMVVLGHSVGAVSLAAWVHDYAPPVRAMILVTPALRVRLYVPFARAGLRLLRLISRRQRRFISSYVKGRLLTHDETEARRYDEDPLISRSIAVNVLLGLYDTATRLIADAGAIRTPTLLLAGGADWVVKLSAERDFFERLGSPIKRMRVFDDMYHDILHEKDRRDVFNELRVFIHGVFSREEPPSSVEDETAHTWAEYRRLAKRLPFFSAKRLWFAGQKLFMKTTGQLSGGIRLGWRAGFDSGSSLDYVYANQSTGGLFVGKLMDRVYLNNTAWVGIRQRKENLEILLREAITRVLDTGQRVRILDVASGRGRYVLETVASFNDERIEVVLRDYAHANVEAGRAAAARLGLKDVTCERADAFEPCSYASLDPKPNIIIVSGLFELFPDNQPVRACLEGIGDSIESGGYLIYTGQPWHPQIEMIARVLTNREGDPWIMRRRTQRELDALVAEAGFEKVQTAVGGRGIFTVSLARRS